MASYPAGGGFQLPLHRRLSRLYNDTKKSTDFLQEPVRTDDDPHVRGLHRKLRIQKDRFVGWGLEWSGPSLSPDMDDCLSEAGLGDDVASIMSTIKDTLAEAEALWQASKPLVGSPHRKPPLLHWDSARFEDLVHDLARSIDTLYDLSRSRALPALSSRRSKPDYRPSPSADDARLFESSRVQTPRNINPRHILTTSPSHGQLVFLQKSAYLDLVPSTPTLPYVPLLLEYATFDPIYTATGIMPEMACFEKLSAALQQDPQRAPGSWTGMPRLLGYFEDMENSRLGLIYRLPFSFIDLSPGISPDSQHLHLCTLNRLVASPDGEPPLEVKFKLALNLSNTIFDIHTKGLAHGNLSDNVVSFRPQSSVSDKASPKSANLRCPVVSSFALFGEGNSAAHPSPRHDPDNRAGPASPQRSSTDERVLDLHSLAMLLVSIGLWTTLEALPDLACSPESCRLLDLLAARCGSYYVKAVMEYWHALYEDLSGHAKCEPLIAALHVRASCYLEACCLLDDMDERDRHPTQNLRHFMSQKPRPIDPPKDDKAAIAFTSMSSDRKPSPTSTGTSVAPLPEKPSASDVNRNSAYIALKPWPASLAHYSDSFTCQFATTIRCQDEALPARASLAWRSGEVEHGSHAANQPRLAPLLSQTS